MTSETPEHDKTCKSLSLRLSHPTSLNRDPPRRHISSLQDHASTQLSPRTLLRNHLLEGTPSFHHETTDDMTPDLLLSYIPWGGHPYDVVALGIHLRPRGSKTSPTYLTCGLLSCFSCSSKTLRFSATFRLALFLFRTSTHWHSEPSWSNPLSLSGARLYYQKFFCRIASNLCHSRIQETLSILRFGTRAVVSWCGSWDGGLVC